MMWFWIALAVLAIASFIIVLACCRLSGQISRREEGRE